MGKDESSYSFTGRIGIGRLPAFEITKNLRVVREVEWGGHL